ncbi:hypothetical protein HQ563_01225 [bacterium]|nr:hypothetical protein [bacterium]
MRDRRRYCDNRLRRLLGALVAVVALGLVGADAGAAAAGAVRKEPKPSDKGAIYQFLRGNGVPIDARIPLAKVSALIKTRYKVRSVVKIIRPQKLPSQTELKETRKKIARKMRKGSRIMFGAPKAPSELELLRQNILAGEVIEFHPSEKLGELELFFSKTQSLKVQIGYDMFYIRIGDKDCTFRSSSLRRQLSRILQR